MKKLSSILKVTTISCSLLLASTSYASTDYDHRCDDLSGTWTGQASLQWYKFTCNYLSIAKVSPGNPTVGEVSVAKSSGPFLCPSIRNHIVKVYCQDGVLELKDNQIDLVGVLSYDGRYAELSGTLFSRVRDHHLDLVVTKSN